MRTSHDDDWDGITSFFPTYLTRRAPLAGRVDYGARGATARARRAAARRGDLGTHAGARAQGLFGPRSPSPCSVPTRCCCAHPPRGCVRFQGFPTRPWPSFSIPGRLGAGAERTVHVAPCARAAPRRLPSPCPCLRTWQRPLTRLAHAGAKHTSSQGPQTRSLAWCSVTHLLNHPAPTWPCADGPTAATTPPPPTRALVFAAKAPSKGPLSQSNSHPLAGNRPCACALVRPPPSE